MHRHDSITLSAFVQENNDQRAFFPCVVAFFTLERPKTGPKPLSDKGLPATTGYPGTCPRRAVTSSRT
jgi:hypothetical protein